MFRNGWDKGDIRQGRVFLEMVSVVDREMKKGKKEAV
jgi:hypothetical protein